MTLGLVKGAVFWFKKNPPKDRVSDTPTPANIVLGKPNVDYDKKVLVFGFYGIIFIGTNNTMKRKSVPVIDLKDSKKWDG